MYIALKKLGIEAQLVRYPDVGHMLGSKAFFDLLERTPAWFDRFLKPEPVP
jgi:dipeptidyl aminopeptidase/acylaminoacyl peptidase